MFVSMISMIHSAGPLALFVAKARFQCSHHCCPSSILLSSVKTSPQVNTIIMCCKGYCIHSCIGCTIQDSWCDSWFKLWDLCNISYHNSNSPPLMCWLWLFVLPWIKNKPLQADKKQGTADEQLKIYVVWSVMMMVQTLDQSMINLTYQSPKCTSYKRSTQPVSVTCFFEL